MVFSFNTPLSTTQQLKLIQPSYTRQPHQFPKGRLSRLLRSSNPSQASSVWCVSISTIGLISAPSSMAPPHSQSQPHLVTLPAVAPSSRRLSTLVTQNY